jgi:hypothetical protein
VEGKHSGSVWPIIAAIALVVFFLFAVLLIMLALLVTVIEKSFGF